MTGCLLRLKRKNGRSVVNRNKTTCVLCHGFNNFFEPPKFDGENPATSRTAVVIKKCDFYDDWGVYDAMFWRIIQRISFGLNATIRIRFPESKSGEMKSLKELRAWRKQQAATDPEFGIDAPTEIRFIKGDSVLCFMTLEDWSDIGRIEPYSCSYTFSFYSYEKSVDALINDSIATQLSQEEAVAEVKTINELVSPKWYWPILNTIKSENFLIYVGLSVLVLFAIAMILQRWLSV